MSGSSQMRPAPNERSFMGHPRGLLTLFTTEMWERFSYYGMRSILLYYLIDTTANGGLQLSEGTGKAVLATYASAIYLLAIVGGWVSDRLCGPRRAVIYGGLILIFGHILLVLPADAASYLGICLVALGTGLIKPNGSTMLGQLYEPGDKHRDAGFSLFYLGINIGSFFAPFLVGAVRSYGGYHAGFVVAAIGMSIALIFYTRGHKYLDPAADRVPNPITVSERHHVSRTLFVGFVLLVFFILLVHIGIVSGALDFIQPGKDNLWLSTFTISINFLALIIPASFFVIMFRSQRVTPYERKRLSAYIPIFFAAMLFWMIFEQAASSMSAFAKDSTQLNIGSLPIKAEWYQSVNPLCILILSGLFAMLWTKLGDRVSTAMKFAVGIGLAGLSFIWLGSWASVYEGGLAPWWVLALTYVIQTFGEMCVSPVGLATTTMLAPKAFRSQALALWFMASAAGQAVTAFIFRFTEHFSANQVFFMTGVVGLVAMLAMIACAPWVTRNIRAGQM